MLKKIENSEFFVSSEGKVYNSKMLEISQSVNKKGYCIAHIQFNTERKTCIVHRLIAQAFIPNPENKPQVNHLDGDKTNNKIENLEWVTQEENMDHAKNILGHFKGEKAASSILTDKEVLDIVPLLRSGFKNEEIAKMFNVRSHMIKQIRRGIAWKHITKGEIFQSGKGISDQQYLTIKYYLHKGLKIKDITGITGLSKSTVVKVSTSKIVKTFIDNLLETSTTIESIEQLLELLEEASRVGVSTPKCIASL